MSVVGSPQTCTGLEAGASRSARARIAAKLTPAMQQRFHQIAQEIPDFHFGRFDVRFPTLECLQRGDEFSIIEFNGAGSEATHIWDRDMSLWGAYRVLRAALTRRLILWIGA